jgi:UDP-2-acetamido-2-deoxy-ribo-hexuluronate aminotransferase
MTVPFIDLKSQYKALKPRIQERINAVLEHGAYVNGPEVAELETTLAKFTGTKYSVACASGTDALLLPMMALGIGPGDEVITTAMSFIATAETIVLSGATPVYIDIDPVTFNMDPSLIEKAITKKTKAIMPVSLYGQVAEMDAINAIAQKYGLAVIEDSAQSFGATYKGKRSCNLSTFGGTSFFPAKPLGAYGDAGAVFTNDDKHYTLLKEIREHGSEKRYYHTRLGINARLDTLQCAILLAKMERYPWEIERRQALGERYGRAFSEIKVKNFSYPKILPHNTSVWAQYTLTVDNREAFQKGLSDRGIPTSIHYPRIMPEQPWYKEQLQKSGVEVKLTDWPKSRFAADHVISLPMFPDMDEPTQDKVIKAVLEVIKG